MEIQFKTHFKVDTWAIKFWEVEVSFSLQKMTKMSGARVI